MVDAYRAGASPRTRPWEFSSVHTATNRCGSLGRATRGKRGGCRFDGKPHLALGKSRYEMLRDGAAVADVADHHCILHGPRILAIDETAQTGVAVVLAGGVSLVHGFAFHKKTVLSGEDGQRVALQVKDKVGHFVQVLPVVANHLRLTPEASKAALVKPRNFACFSQPVFNNPLEMNRHYILPCAN